MGEGKKGRILALAVVAAAVCWASAAEAHDGAGFRRGALRRAFRQQFLGSVHGGVGFRRSIVRSCDPGFVEIGFPLGSFDGVGIGCAPAALSGAGFAYDPCAAGGIQTLGYGAFGVGAAGYGAAGFAQPVIVERPVFVPVRQRLVDRRRLFGRRGFGFRDRGFFGRRGGLRRALAFRLLGGF
jgi:hypothetical protein